MNSRLMNVRLDERRMEMARRLRANGIKFADLVRDAIDRRYAEFIQSASARDVESIMNDIYERYPDPPSSPARDYDLRDRREARAAVLRKLQRKRP